MYIDFISIWGNREIVSDRLLAQDKDKHNIYENINSNNTRIVRKPKHMR